MNTMQTTLDKMKSRREVAQERMKAILDGATSEHRDLKPHEVKWLEDVEREITNLDSQIEQTQERLERATKADEVRDIAMPILRAQAGTSRTLTQIMGEVRALVGTSGDGADLVQMGYADFIWQKALKNSVLDRVPRRIIETRDTSVQITMGTAFMTAGWTHQGTATAASDPGYNPVQVTPRKLSAVAIHANELESDQGLFEQHLDSLVGYFGTQIDAGFVTGNGAAPNPNGLAGLTLAITAGGTPTISDLGAFSQAMGTAYASDIDPGVFLISGSAWSAYLQLKRSGTDNSPLILTGDSVDAGPVARVFGVPVVVSNHLSGNQGYLIGRDAVVEVRRQGTFVFRDPYSLSATDQTLIRITARVDWAFDENRIVDVTFGPA